MKNKRGKRNKERGTVKSKIRSRSISKPIRFMDDESEYGTLSIPMSMMLQAGNEEFRMDGKSGHLAAYKIPSVFSVINPIMRAMGALPYKVRSRKDRKEIPGHDLLTFLEKPNDADLGSDYRENWACHLLLAGNVYEYLNLDGGDNLAEITRIPPDSITPEGDDNIGSITGYKYGEKTLAPEVVSHSKLANPLDWKVGASPIDTARVLLDIDSASMKFFRDFFKNAMAPRGHIEAPQDMSQSQFEEALEMLRRAWRRSISHGVPLFSTGKWTNIGINPADTGTADMQKWALYCVCFVYGMNPEVLGLPDAKTYDNYATGRKAFYQNTVAPYANKYCQSVNARLMEFFDDPAAVEFYYDLNEIDVFADDNFSRRQQSLEEVKNGCMTPDEFRIKYGGEPYPRKIGSNPLIPANLQPLEVITGAGGDYAQKAPVAPAPAIQLMELRDSRIMFGGSGSGNFGHAGRPGEVGGSGEGGGGSHSAERAKWEGVKADAAGKISDLEGKMRSAREKYLAENPKKDGESNTKYRERVNPYKAGRAGLTSDEQSLLDSSRRDYNSATDHLSFLDEKDYAEASQGWSTKGAVSDISKELDTAGYDYETHGHTDKGTSSYIEVSRDGEHVAQIRVSDHPSPKGGGYRTVDSVMGGSRTGRLGNADIDIHPGNKNVDVVAKIKQIEKSNAR